MEEIVKALESKWKDKHVESSEDAFARVRVEGQATQMQSFFAKSDIPVTAMAARRN